MSTAAKDMKAALATYIKNVEGTLNDLAELEVEAESYRAVLESNERINLEVETAQREIANLRGQKQELYQDFYDAQFQGDHLKVKEIEGKRDEIDQRIAELQAGIEDSLAGLQDLDAVAVAGLLARLWKTRSPKFIYDYRGLGVERVYTNYTGWSELVKELERGDRELKDQISEIHQSIENNGDWMRHADVDRLREVAPGVADKYFGTLKMKQRNERFAETMKRAKQIA